MLKGNWQLTVILIRAVPSGVNAIKKGMNIQFQHYEKFFRFSAHVTIKKMFLFSLKNLSCYYLLSYYIIDLCYYHYLLFLLLNWARGCGYAGVLPLKSHLRFYWVNTNIMNNEHILEIFQKIVFTLESSISEQK